MKEEKIKAQSKGYQGTGGKKRLNSGKRDKGQRCVSEAKEGAEYVQEDGKQLKGCRRDDKGNYGYQETKFKIDSALQKTLQFRKISTWKEKFKMTGGSTGFLTPSATSTACHTYRQL